MTAPSHPRRAPFSTLTLLLIPAAGAVALALITATQIYLAMWNHGHSLLRMVVWQMALWAFWLCSAPWILRIAGRTTRLWVLAPLGLGLVLLHLLAAGLATSWIIPFAVVGQPYTGPEHSLTDWIRVAVPYILLPDPAVYLLLIVGGRALASSERAWQLELRESQLESDLSRAQLDALRLEIEPHFLFNTLNSIAALIRLNDNGAALAMLLRLSDLMRSTLDRTSGQYTSLGEEVAHVARYVDLQRARFNDRLSVIYAVDPSCDPLPVPAFLLQPIVENALRHGLSPNARPGRIEIGARQDDERLRLWVRDDGTGLPASFDLQRDAGTGLRNISARLERIYGPHAQLALRTNETGGTTAEVLLPSVAPAVTVRA
ncbi:MAG TPA: histidine kinase [Vicinamibacterales bacterium]|jgi:signal transduction histidine kinase|nr:histidine kinase [Vicinamibacterales bacterium]